MSNSEELLPMPEWMDKAADVLDRMAATGLACRDIKQGFRKTFLTAECVSQLLSALTEEVMRPIMDLQGSSIGFKTDKDNPKDGSKPGYPIHVVKEALIDAVMNGLLPCGNQFNIIGGRMYVTKEGFTYILGQAGVKYDIFPVILKCPRVDEAIVACDISWSYGDSNGKKRMEIPVRINKMMGTDAILGKADRKSKAWLWNHLMHTKLSDGDTDGDAEGKMRDVTPTRTASPMQAGSAKASPLRSSSSARVVEVESAPADKPAEQAAADCAGTFDRLKMELADAGNSWRGLAKWLAGKGVNVPHGGTPEELDRFAAWVYSQEPLIADMVAASWIVRGML